VSYESSQRNEWGITLEEKVKTLILKRNLADQNVTVLQDGSSLG
jgi:hypothetical protein